VTKQQFYKNTKTHKNIFEHFFMLRTHKLMQMKIIHIFWNLALMKILENVNKNVLWYFFIVIFTHAKKIKSCTKHLFLLIYSHNHFYNA
jgi:hypothetical protein